MTGSGDYGGVYSFEIEDGFQMQVYDSFRAIWQQNQNPCVSSIFIDFEGMSNTTRCFIVVKVHEMSAMVPETQTCSARVPVQLLDLNGNLRRGTVWPSMCNRDIWTTDAVITVLGCSPNMNCNSWNLGRDCCVTLDESTTQQFPLSTSGTNWEIPCT